MNFGAFRQFKHWHDTYSVSGVFVRVFREHRNTINLNYIRHEGARVDECVEIYFLVNSIPFLI